MKKEKLAIFTGGDIRSLGGGQKYVLELSKRLPEFDITIFTKPKKNEPQAMDYDTIHRYANANIREYHAPDIPVVEDRFILTSSGIGALRELKDYDVVYMMDHSPITNKLAQRICKKYGVRFIFGMHDSQTLRELPVRNTFVRRQLIKLYKRVRNSGIMTAPSIRVVNEYDGKKLEEMGYKGKLYYITDFINIKTKLSDIKVNKKEFIALFANRLGIHHKGVDFLEKIVDEVSAKNPDIHFRIVGKGEGEQIVKGIVSKHPDCVKYLGFLSEADLRKEYQNADLIIFPSRFESFGLSLAEAQGYGCPGIAFRVRGPENIMKEKVQGELIKPYDTKAFAAAIIAYYKKWLLDKKQYLKAKKIISKITMDRFGEDAIIPRIRAMLNGE